MKEGIAIATGLFVFSEITGVGRGFTDKAIEVVFPHLESLFQNLTFHPYKGGSPVADFLSDFRKQRIASRSNCPLYFPRGLAAGTRAGSYSQIARTREEIASIKARHPLPS